MTPTFHTKTHGPARPERPKRPLLARLAAGLAVAGPLLFGPACSSLLSGIEVAESVECPETARTIVDIIDVSGTGRGSVQNDSRREVIKHHIAEAADCEERLVVLGYSQSAAAHIVIYDKMPLTEGATEQARDLELADLIETEITEFDAAYESALQSVSADGSDLVAAFVLAEDQVAINGTEAPLAVTIFSDGINTSGRFFNNDMSFRAEQVTNELANGPVADLAGQTVNLSGIGRVATDPQPPSEYLEALRISTLEICESTGATCQVTTNEVRS